MNDPKPIVKYGVMWKRKPVPGESDEWQEYGEWYDDLAPALSDLDKAAANPRCADARVYMRLTDFRVLTGNAVEWMEAMGE